MKAREPGCTELHLIVDNNRHKVFDEILADRGRDAQVPSAPRTDPDERHSRIRLPPRVFDGKADARPGMKDTRSREPVIGQLRSFVPTSCRSRWLRRRSVRARGSMMDAEGAERTDVGRHGVIGEEACDDLLQPRPCSGMGWCMRRRSSSLISLSFALMRSRRVFRLIWNLPRRVPADEGEAQEVEGLRFAKPAPRRV